MSQASRALDIVIFGLSITSSWGNGHATTFRALVRGLHGRGHRVRFYERDVPWYAAHRDLPCVPGCRTILYDSLGTLEAELGDEIEADLVIVGSFVPEGPRLARWIFERASGLTAFYDIDTPLTLERLARGECDYLEPELVPQFDLYLSFACGPVIDRLSTVYGARYVRPLYCSVDENVYRPLEVERRYDLGYLGTYSADRQPKLEALLNEAARRWPSGRFCVAGSQYPPLAWPATVERIEHVPPAGHALFYGSQRFTLNVTRADMVAAGYSPSVRLFEAAACGVPVISDPWNGLEAFFVPGRDILIAESADDVLAYLRELGDARAREIGANARGRVLAEHTAHRRAIELESYVTELSGGCEVAHAI